MKVFLKSLKDTLREIEIRAAAKLSNNRGEIDQRMVLIVLTILVGLAIAPFVLKDVLPMVKDWIIENIKKLFSWGN